jgi:hypothetical protein
VFTIVHGSEGLTNNIDGSSNSHGRSLLDEIVREGAQRMLAVALQAEVAAYVEAHAGVTGPGGALEGHHVKADVALEGRPIKTGCHEDRATFRVMWCRRKDLLEEHLGDRHATRVDLTGLAKLLERRVPLLIAGMGQALGSCGEAHADAVVFVACRPRDGSLVHHAPPASSGPPDRTVSALSDEQQIRHLLLR